MVGHVLRGGARAQQRDDAGGVAVVLVGREREGVGHADRVPAPEQQLAQLALAGLPPPPRELVARRVDRPGHGQAATVSRSALSTWSSWVFGDAFGITCTTVPSASMMNVERCTPMYVLPYIDFSPHVPYCSATAWSESASRVKLRSCPSWNLRIASTESGETPSTVTPAAS